MSILAECSGSDRRGLGMEGLLARDSLPGGGVTVLCPSAGHFIHCLVLIQSGKTHPDMTEKLLTPM